MIIVDANVLLYANQREAEHHRRAKRFLEDALNGNEVVALSWVTVLAFLRVSTNPRAYRRPLTIEQAVEKVRRWLRQPCVQIVSEPEECADHLLSLLTETRAHGNLVMDAHLTAIATRHGATLVSFDQDFRRFPGLRWTVPPSLH